MKTIGFDDFLPQGDEIRLIHRQIEERRMVHAILITGEPGTGKRTLAFLIASALLCREQTGVPCGKCDSCRLAISGEHPDMIVIEKGKPISPDISKGRSTIPADDIREMIRLCSQYSFQGGNRIVLIPDAENMTPQAQNCLLKILEEPPLDTYFILTSAHPDQLIVTVKSRCRPMKLVPWESDYIRKILEEQGIDSLKAKKAALYASGSIGNALRLAADNDYWIIRENVMEAFFRNRKRSDILLYSTAWKEKKTEAATVFGILEDCIRQLLLCRLKLENPSILNDYPTEWLNFAEKAPLSHFSSLHEKIRDARKQNAFNVNFQAIIEQLLLAFTGEGNLWVK